jgi:hypothetical protein
MAELTNTKAMDLHELKIWISGFSSALDKMTGKNPLNNDQWQYVLEKIMAAEDASTTK